MKNYEESNKLIAEFMGYKKYNDAPGDFPDGYYCDSNSSLPMFPEDFCYNDSWNWLMPVVEKVEALQPEGYNTLIEGRNCWIETSGNTFQGYSHNSKIEAIYNAVVEFIKWHNQNI